MTLPSAARAPFAAGHRIGGKYQVVRVLGTGGMGEVYEAENVALRKRVAVKVLRPEFGVRPEFRARFEREAIAAAALGHPHIVAVFDLGSTDDGSLFMVQELLAGEDLRARLDRDGRLAWATALPLLLPILDALAVAHARGIVHRDIKPANIFLCANAAGAPTPKLIDFGVAKILEGATGDVAQTRTGMLIGTLSYMAPEQLRAEPDIDGRADQWAIATVLYEVLAGRCPFLAPTGETSSLAAIAEFVRAVHDETPPRLEQIALDVPRPLADVIHAALQADRQRRFPDLETMAAALGAASAPAPVALAGPSESTMVGLGDSALHPVAPARPPTAPPTAPAPTAPKVAPVASTPAARAVVARPSASSGPVLVIVAALAVALAAIGLAVWRLTGTASTVAVAPGSPTASAAIAAPATTAAPTPTPTTTTPTTHEPPPAPPAAAAPTPTVATPPVAAPQVAPAAATHREPPRHPRPQRRESGTNAVPILE